MGTSGEDVERWNPERFDLFLNEAMSSVGLSKKSQLSRRSGIRETQFTNWREGTRPRPDILERLAPALALPVAVLLVESGWVREDDLRVVDGALDLPIEFQQAMELWTHGDAATRRDLLDHMQIVLRAVIDHAEIRQRTERARDEKGTA